MEIADFPEQRANRLIKPIHGAGLTSLRGSLATNANSQRDLERVHALSEKMNLLLLKGHYLAQGFRAQRQHPVRSRGRARPPPAFLV
ncbi:hypothetical protein ON010_g1625 [Phytophthora cinnamomi]|nr:hypothetical protein ON010_g1625 [Phytophthora cinnamomi]